MPAHQKKISVDLRGFHIFDDNESSDDEEENEARETKKTLKSKIKHAQMISVDLSGYHLFKTEDDSSDEDDDKEDEDAAGATSSRKEETERPASKKMHSKKISVDLRGFDMFYESDPSSDDDSEGDDDFGRVGVDTKDAGEAAKQKSSVDKEQLAKNANSTFKRAQKLYLGNKEEDEDLKGFHLFDEYDSDDEEAIKLNELTKDQLADLVRGFIVENALLKDANTRARDILTSKKNKLKNVEESKRQVVRQLAMEMDNMRNYIRGLGSAQTGGLSWLGL